MSRIECYIDDNLKDSLKEKASEEKISLSKYVTKVLEDHLEKNEEAFNHTKTHTLLAHIFSCVYDKDIHKLNAEKIKEMVHLIDEDVRKKI